MNSFVLIPSPSSLPISLFSASDSFKDYMRVERSSDTMIFHQLLFVLSGKGKLICEGKEYALSKGCAFYISEGVPYSQFSLDGLTTAFVTVRGNGMAEVQRTYAEKKFLFFEETDVEKWQGKISEVVKEHRKGGKEGRLSSLAYSLFIDFFENSENVSVTPLDRVLRYLEQNLSRKMSLSEIASEGGVSVSTLCHEFKRTYGKTVVQFINDKRLEWGHGYLTANPASLIKEVAFLSGFDDVSYFCKAYKKKYGKSPKG